MSWEALSEMQVQFKYLLLSLWFPSVYSCEETKLNSRWSHLVTLPGTLHFFIMTPDTSPKPISRRSILKNFIWKRSHTN